jgi:hypothetical protein
MNNEYSEIFRKTGHKYHIDTPAVFQGAVLNGAPVGREGSLKKTITHLRERWRLPSTRLLRKL